MDITNLNNSSITLNYDISSDIFSSRIENAPGYNSSMQVGQPGVFVGQGGNVPGKYIDTSSCITLYTDDCKVPNSILETSKDFEDRQRLKIESTVVSPSNNNVDYSGQAYMADGTINKKTGKSVEDTLLMETNTIKGSGLKQSTEEADWKGMDVGESGNLTSDIQRNINIDLDKRPRYTNQEIKQIFSEKRENTIYRPYNTSGDNLFGFPMYNMN